MIIHMHQRHESGGKRRRSSALAVACVGCIAVQSPVATAQEPALKLYSKSASYDDVKFELQNAIIGRGLNVDFNGQLSKMLERTGADVGSSKPVYRQAEYFTFCSAKLSRSMMEADPANIGFCPYVVFIYETAAAPGTISVGYRRPPAQGSDASRAALADIDALLDGIVKEAVK